VKLIEGKAVSMKIRKGSCLCCEDGILWATAAGRDFLLKSGEDLSWQGRTEKIVIFPVGRYGAECLLKSK